MICLGVNGDGNHDDKSSKGCSKVMFRVLGGHRCGRNIFFSQSEKPERIIKVITLNSTFNEQALITVIMWKYSERIRLPGLRKGKIEEKPNIWVPLKIGCSNGPLTLLSVKEEDFLRICVCSHTHWIM